MTTRFFSCDWGTSTFRLRLVNRATGMVVDEVRTDEGVRSLAGDTAGFERVMATHLGALEERHPEAGDGLPVVISGMASSSVGWRELPYSPLPFGLNGRGAIVARLGFERVVLLVSGVASERDVMRGEETELLGLFADPELAGLDDCLVVLPGTHSKHVELRQGWVTGFRTFMTGELFAVLGTHSMLAHSIGGETCGELAGATLEGFLAGVEATAGLPLAHALFTVRTNQLLGRFDKAANRAYLSGLLIGHELCSAAGTAGAIVLAASGAQAEPYRLAAERLGFGERLVLPAPERVALAPVRGQAIILTRYEQGEIETR